MAEQTIASTGPTDAEGVSVPGKDVGKLVDVWVGRAERWLWTQPRQALLEDDYQAFLAELKKKL